MYTYEGKRGARARTPSREGHSFQVSQTRKSVICSRPRVPDSAKRRTNPTRITAVEDELTSRQRTLATHRHLCVHTIGPFGLLGLGHSFHVPQPRVDRMRTGKTGTLVFTNTAVGEETIDSMSTHRPTQRAQPFRRITENDALIRWLGGLQGWRTAVRDVEGNSALKESKKRSRRDGLLAIVSARDEAKGEGR